MWTVCLPLAVQLSQKDWFILNLNHYRNAHYRTLAKAKIEFTERVMPLLGNIPKLDHITIGYKLFTPTNRAVDTNNVISIVDKFFCDTLVDAGKLEDDNCRILPGTTSKWGGVDRDNPRVEATLLSVNPDYEVMVIEGNESQT